MAFNFAGGTDKIYYGTLGGPWPSVGCMSFRLKTTQTTFNAVPVALWSSHSRLGFGFIINNTANKVLAITVDGSGTVISMISATSVNDGNWHTVALNYDTGAGNTNTLYIDGNSEASGSAAGGWGPIATLDQVVALGDGYNSFWAPYVGSLAEIALWNRQLDANEINILSKDMSPARIAPNALILHAPLVGPARDRCGKALTGPTGTTTSVHPRVIYPEI